MRLLKRCHFAGLAALVLGLLSGCAAEPARRVMPKGQLLYNGKPYKASPQDGLDLTFIEVSSDDKPGDSFIATFNADDASFVVPGRQGKGIPPGKYRIGFMQMSVQPTELMNQLNEEFSPANTQILRDIQSDEPLRIDLGKPQG